MITDTDTGIATQGRTGSGGTYSIGELLPGTYSIEVSKSGFESFQETGLGVTAGQTVRVDVQLRMGTSKQVVSVTGAAPLVHTDLQSINVGIQSRVVEDLPKSMRSIDALLQLMPGVSSTNSTAEIAGSTYWGGDNWSLNGTSIQDATNGRGQGSTVGFNSMPTTEALQEFKLDSGTLNAEFGQPTGISMVLKQGTNSFHGEAYGYFENRKLDANAFSANAQGQAKPAYDRDEYGGLIGGPIIKNKFFFFANFYHFRQVSPSIVTDAFPSMAMHNGNFGALCGSYTAAGLCNSAPAGQTTGTQLFNPLNGNYYPNNVIGTTFSATANTVLPFYALPNETVTANPNGLPGAGANYQSSISNIYSKDNVESRLDWTISSKDSLNGIWHWSTSPKWFLSGGITPQVGNYLNYRDYSDLISATEIHSFGGTAVNEFHGTWARYIQQREGQNPQVLPWNVVPGIAVQPTFGLPTFSTSGYTTIDDYGTGTAFPMYTVEFGDNFTKTHGKHTFKAGALESAYKFSVPVRDGALTGLLGTYNGAFTTSGQWTGGKGWYPTSGCSATPASCASVGNAFADFLLGDIDSDNYALLINGSQFTSRDLEMYAQDSWQATPKLTVNFGLRYTFQTPWQARNLIYAPFDFKTNKLMLLESGSTPVTPPTGFANLMAAYPFETSASVGISPSNYYQNNTDNWGPRFGFAWRPFGGTKTVVRGGYGFYYAFFPSEIGTIEMTFNPPFNSAPSYTTGLAGSKLASGFAPDLTFANAFPAASAHGPQSNPQLYSSPRNLMLPRQEQWTMTVEHQFSNNWMARLTYLGEQTQHLYTYADNLNQPAVQTPNVSTQVQRPWQPWAGINYNATPSGIQNYGQLQAELIKHFANGFSLQAEYAWTHALDDVPIAASFNNPWCETCEYGDSQYIPLQHLVFNYVYELPFGNGHHFLNHKGPADWILGGWEISGITSYFTGAPTSESVAFSVPSSVTGWYGGRADRLAGVPLYQKGSGHNVIASGSYHGLPYINTAAFAPPQKWTYGDSARDLIIPPGAWNYDISAMKSVPIHEAIRMQVRGDFLDAFNHCNLGGPGLTLGDTRDGGTANASFGLVTGCSASIAGASGTGRIIQLGVRLLF
jgi:hypothetical protein